MKILPYLILIYFLAVGNTEQWCFRDMVETAFHASGEELRVLIVWFPVRAGTHSKLQLCSHNTGQPIERECSGNSQDSENATWISSIQEDVLLNCSSIANNCFPEKFEHYYVMKNKIIQNHTNYWLPAKLGEVASTHDPCLLKTGLPLTRKCVYNTRLRSAEWEDKDYHDVQCLREINQDIVTYDLNKLYLEVRERNATASEDIPEAATRLRNLLSKANTVRIPADLQISTNILEIITRNDRQPELVPKVLEATNLLMQADEEIIRTSHKMGTTTALVKMVEKYLDATTHELNCSRYQKGVAQTSQNRLSVFYINPSCANISGIGVYTSSAHSSANMLYDQPTNTYFRYLYMNQSVDQILNEPNVEAAVYLPESLWKSILNTTANVAVRNSIRISLYREPNFFADTKNDGKIPDSVTLRMSIPEYQGTYRVL